jgi:hypothetical protein
MVFKLQGPSTIRSPEALLFYDGLNDTEKEVFSYIAVNGPIDAYRASKNVSKSLTATQQSFKKLTEKGIFQIKEIVLGATQQNRKVYSLTLSGFCIALSFMLNKGWSDCTFEDVHRLIKQYPEYFPGLFDNWDQIIDDMKVYYKGYNWDEEDYGGFVIPVPDGPTRTLCEILWHAIDGVLSNRVYYDAIPTTLFNSFVPNLLDPILHNPPPIDQGGTRIGALFYALKRQHKLWKIIEPEIRIEYDRIHEEMVFIEKLLK